VILWFCDSVILWLCDSVRELLEVPSVHRLTATRTQLNGENNKQFSGAAAIAPFLPLADYIFMTDTEYNIF